MSIIRSFGMDVTRGDSLMVTQKQIAALKWLIFCAKVGTELTKRVLAYLIDNSELLTREVCVVLNVGDGEFSRNEIDAAARGMQPMQSSHGSVHLDEIMYVSGSMFWFSVHYGDYDPTREGERCSSAGIVAGYPENLVLDKSLIESGHPLRYTFWLAKEDYSRTAELLTPSREELDQIDITDAGLYHH